MDAGHSPADVRVPAGVQPHNANVMYALCRRCGRVLAAADHPQPAEMRRIMERWNEEGLEARFGPRGEIIVRGWCYCDWGNY